MTEKTTLRYALAMALALSLFARTGISVAQTRLGHQTTGNEVTVAPNASLSISSGDKCFNLSIIFIDQADCRVGSPDAGPFLIGQLAITIRYIDSHGTVLRTMSMPTAPTVANVTLLPSQLFYSTSLISPKLEYDLADIFGAVKILFGERLF